MFQGIANNDNLININSSNTTNRTKADFFRVILGAIAATSLVLSAYPKECRADVSFQRGNGNVFFSFKDTVQPSVERVYNSKSAYKGMFGWGWGNPFDTYLEVAPDGSVVVHEFGAGADNRFSPLTTSQADADEAISTMVGLAQRSGELGSAGHIETYRQKLKSSLSFRNEEWARFVSQGKAPAKQLKEGTQLRSNRFSYQYITKITGGYVRVSETGKTERFDAAGRLVRVSDKNGNHADLYYGKDGVLQKSIDSFNRKLFFTFDKKKLVVKITTETGRTAEYRYNDGDELISSKDIANNRYGYSYDSQGRHNLTGIKYSDGTDLAISYYGKDKFENVRSVKDRDGTLTEYGFEYDPKDKGHSTVRVVVKDTKGEVFAKNSYEYFAKTKANGEEWTWKLVLNDLADQLRTETTYDENCGLPVSIKKGKEESRFNYDAKCRVVRKDSPDETTELAYDPKAGKVAKVTSTVKTEEGARGVASVGSHTSWSEFRYDEKSNLVFAKNSEGKEISLLNDPAGRITAILEKGGHQIRFKYNEEHKPVEIIDPAVGSIRVTYSNSGEIKNVDSAQGRKIASSVTQTFQSLLNIIRPAGVTLTF